MTEITLWPESGVSGTVITRHCCGFKISANSEGFDFSGTSSNFGFSTTLAEASLPFYKYHVTEQQAISL
jgi:hypothetical protein